ncbi:hypothetical protein TREPR_0778 [Treponema primitia ZAS-2]|uniref:Tetratricopeptide repeat domain protein n=1 Tax=Treponema primitia (strain ATCC BAA-887 / DSM 12427 / ZAS-2) TaxID=545694 RepID=F5YJB5_TREPZ|nr:hypothetical protein [Treponema primitia]AEF83949.1 hypothetical protein TREPR_0778 [Treponema primitia ZAS-2]
MKRAIVIPPPGKHLPDSQRFRLQLLCFLGLALALVVLGTILFLTFYVHRPDAAGGSFSGELKKIDAQLSVFYVGETANPDPARFNALLDRLEKKAIGVESRLSILKRRRILVRLSAGENRDHFRAAYREAAARAAEAFPFSEPLAAIAAESLISDLPDGLSENRRNKLEQYAGLLSESRFITLALDIQVLLGALSDPETALSRGAELLAAGAASTTDTERESFLINGTLYRLLRGDKEGALSQVVSLLQSPDAGDQSLRFGAEFFYDMDNPMRAAELFSRFSDTSSMGRLADSLWLAGFKDGAAEIWAALVSPPVLVTGEAAGSQAPGVETSLKIRSLYNLARVSKDEQKQAAYFHGLFSEAPGHIYGVIGYSRLFDAYRAENLLTELDAQKEPLLDLELLRRRLDSWEIRRVTAETWLLLGRHPDEEGLYQWGAWYFDRQRQYSETALLLRQARLNGMDGPWLALHDTLRLIREGRLDEAAELLQEQQQGGGIWQIPANLGIIMESRRSVAPALDYYETAASMVKDPRDAARVQLKIAHCLHVMGRDQESRRVLEYVQDLDPDNLSARLELRRLSL